MGQLVIYTSVIPCVLQTSCFNTTLDIAWHAPEINFCILSCLEGWTQMKTKPSYISLFLSHTYTGPTTENLYMQGVYQRSDTIRKSVSFSHRTVSRFTSKYSCVYGKILKKVTFVLSLCNVKYITYCFGTTLIGAWTWDNICIMSCLEVWTQCYRIRYP